MKRLLLILLLCPVLMHAQEQKKVLYMTVTRTVGGALSVPLSEDENWTGPVYDINNASLTIKNSTVLKKRIKEIRFDVRTETVDAIDAPTLDNETGKVAYDLSGRVVDLEKLRGGIYIIGNKKYIKR